MKSQEHWTEDEELLAQFVLGRMHAPRRADLQSHLDSCTRCRERVEQERILAAGVRLDAREELKKRLNARLLGSVSSRSSNWRYAYGAAAVVVLAIGIAILTREPAYEGTITDKRQLTGERAKSAEQRESLPPMTDKMEKTPAEPRGPETGRDQELGKSKGREDSKENRPPFEEAGAAAAVAADEVAQKVLKPEPAAAAGGGAVATDQAARKELTAEQAPSAAAYAGAQGQWIEGDLETVPPPSVAPTALMEAKKDARTMSDVTSKSSISPRQSTRNEVQVSQRASVGLPQTQQQFQRRRAVPTQLTQSGDTLRMTLFFDELVPDSEWKQATVEQVGDDSLVVRVPGRIISYKLPAGMQQQMQGQVKQR